MAGFRLAVLLVVSVVLGVAVPPSGDAHPLGNFSISQYTGIRVTRDAVELRYFVDMAEIPTFQEIQDTGIMAEPGHPSLPKYLTGKADELRRQLRLELDGRPLELRVHAREVIFPPGVGGLPTLKLGVVYRAALPPASADTARLHYRDDNYADRAGWKEVIAGAGPGVRFVSASVPESDRSRELSDYPTDLLNSPPQQRDARLVFLREPAPSVAARPATTPPAPPTGPRPSPAVERTPPRPEPAPEPVAPPPPAAESRPAEPGLEVRPNRQAARANALADLVAMKDLGLGMLLAALGIAAALGAFHALEPGHGKTVVAAYLVGSRGTVRHAVLLGLTVTATHTAGVYLLGGVTLYASRYVVPERLYPWLGVVSGLAIAILGLALFLRRYADPGDHHHHHDGHVHAHGPGHDHSHEHDHADHHSHPHPHPHPGPGAVSLPALLMLGVTGGIVPCPAAVVVLLGALALNRVGFGLLLIVAFSAGLAAVLIAIGVLMVYARRLMGRFDTEGPVLRRWLPLTSSAVITLVGVVITVQALVAAGVLVIRI